MNWNDGCYLHGSRHASCISHLRCTNIESNQKITMSNGIQPNSCKLQCTHIPAYPNTIPTITNLTPTKITKITKKKHSSWPHFDARMLDKIIDSSFGSIRFGPGPTTPPLRLAIAASQGGSFGHHSKNQPPKGTPQKTYKIPNIVRKTHILRVCLYINIYIYMCALCLVSTCFWIQNLLRSMPVVQHNSCLKKSVRFHSNSLPKVGRRVTCLVHHLTSWMPTWFPSMKWNEMMKCCGFLRNWTIHVHPSHFIPIFV